VFVSEYVDVKCFITAGATPALSALHGHDFPLGQNLTEDERCEVGMRGWAEGRERGEDGRRGVKRDGKKRGRW
jgi:hypothetical protein